MSGEDSETPETLESPEVDKELFGILVSPIKDGEFSDSRIDSGLGRVLSPVRDMPKRRNYIGLWWFTFSGRYSGCT